MLDPLSCLSIACSVMQIISFSHEVASIVKRIKTDGSVDPELREHADHLSKASKGLEQYLENSDVKRLPKNQAELQDIAMKCLNTSKDIQSKLDKIDSTRGDPVMRAFKIKWRKSEFDRLEKAMQKYQDTLQTHILVHLCSQSDAAALEQEDRFQNLDRVLQTFIKAYVQGHMQLKKLMLHEFWVTKALISATNEATINQNETEHNKTREYFSATQNALESRRDHEARLRQLLASLQDGSMNARRNQIEKSHTDTFSWIFDEEMRRPWDSFTDWLSSNGSLYWICGKAGSGKSTLMKFLIGDGRTKQQLHKWAPNCSIYVHFIWNSGATIQRSIQGLLRSLLCQIFAQNEYIMDNILQRRPGISKIKNPDDWSREDLEDILFQSLTSHRQAVCIFVDGLDEIDQKDGPFDLLDLVKRISSLPEKKGLKVCVSSRPEASFNLGLEPYPKLKLQDLTNHDMKIYTRDFLRTKCSFNFEGVDESKFIKDVITKAEGVFLWVSLALKSLQRGITNGDDPKMLMERLHTLPSELGKLYEEMLKRVGDDQDLYSKEAALYFNISIAFSDSIREYPIEHWNLFHFAAAFDPTLRDMLLKQKCPPSPTGLKTVLLDVDRRLTSRCAGMLEVVSYPKGQTNVEEILSRNENRPWGDIGIEFIHRSAKEFLLNMNHKLLDQDAISPIQRKFRVLQAMALDDFYPPEQHNLYQNMAMLNMANTEPTLPDEQELDILNLVQEIYQRNGWPEFYEVAARYGLHKSHAHLLEGGSRDPSALRNYLLLCALSGYTQRTNTMAFHLLKMGADPNWIGLVPTVLSGDRYMYFPTPLLAYFLDNTHPGLNRMTTNRLVEKMIRSFLELGADVERKFLSCDFGLSHSSSGKYKHKARPALDASYIGYDGFDLIIERNCVDHILDQYLESSYITQVERSAIISEFGLDTVRAHRKVLLYFHEDTVYGANDEDSEALNEILDWPRSLIPEVRNLVSDEERADRFKRVREMLKGKEVSDVRQWLADRGHMLPEESDVEGISNQASIHEMAEVYRRLNEKFGPRR